MQGSSKVALLAAKRRKEAAEKALEDERQRAARPSRPGVKREGNAAAQPIRVRWPLSLLMPDCRAIACFATPATAESMNKNQLQDTLNQYLPAFSAAHMFGSVAGPCVSCVAAVC